MNIVIFGYKQHGKDTACEYLHKEHGITYSASSEFANELFIFDELKDKYGYKTKEECFKDRVNHRSEWFNMILGYNTPDRTRLGREIFNNNIVYCGIRSREEFLALKEAKLIDISIWIDASKRKPIEDTSSNELTIEDADIVILNNGSLDSFYDKLDKLVVGIHDVFYDDRRDTKH